MAVNKRLIGAGATAAAGGLTPSEHFGVVLYEGDGSSSHSINGGKFGAGAYFNGSNGYINFSDRVFNVPLNGTLSEFSISLWFNASSVPSSGNVEFLSWWQTGTQTYKDGFLGLTTISSNSIRFGDDWQNAYTFSSTSEMVNQWYHLVAVKTSTNAYIYLNGQLESTKGSALDWGFNNFLAIGRQHTAGEYFDGKLDQIRLFSKALSSSEVSTLYAETASTVESLDPLSEDTTDTLQVLGDSSCIATYRFENDETDLSGNYDGTGTQIQYAAGRYGQAASFNGSSSYIDVSSFSFGSNNISLSMWINPASSQNAYTNLFDFQHSSSDAGVFTIQQNNANTNQYQVWQWNGSSYNVSNAVTLTANTWNHLVYTLQSNGNYVLYLNGTSSTTGSNLIGHPSSLTKTLNIGRWQGNPTPGRYFTGEIDQVRVFNKALSASEVTTLYNENSLVASYRFEGNANDDTRNYDGSASNVSYEYGLGFTPDFVWIKNRDTSNTHLIYDSTRGAGKFISSATTNAEAGDAGDLLGSFDTGGFSVNTTLSGGTNPSSNANGEDFVAWCLKANGGTTSSNTDGSITSTVQANQDAGFSIVTWTGDGNVSTVGHGLSQVPEVVITKGRANLATYNQWATYHHSLAENHVLFLNLTDASTNAGVDKYFDDSTFSNTVFGVGDDIYGPNVNGTTMVAYCFHSVDGFSKFGSYEGNGTTEGPMVETGFEPAFIIIKDVDGVDNWAMVDNKRATTNPRQTWLRANLTNAEFSNTVDSINFYSNGFQIAGGTSVSNFLNESGNTFIYMAFAADPDTEAPTVAKSFSTVTYTGTGATNSIDGLGFEPSFTWIKGRTNTASHQIFDTIRGATKGLNSDATVAEFTNTSMLTSFDSDGFTLGGQSSVNGSGVNYVAWNWKADDNEPTIFGGPAVAVYKFEDNSNDVTTNYNGSDTNITYISSGKFNKAAAFNGTNSKIDLGNQTFFRNDFAFSMWIYPTTTSGTDFQILLGKRNNTTGDFGTETTLGLYEPNHSSNANKLFFSIGGGGSTVTTVLSSNTITVNSWNHIVGTIDGTAMALYINEVKSTATFSGTRQTNSTTIALGNRYGADNDNPYGGNMDQLRFYNGALKAEQVTELYNETAADNDDLTLGAPPETIISANANAGFSIVKYTGDGIAGKQVPHGLSAAPEMIIVKNLDNGTSNWAVYHSATGVNNVLFLNGTDAQTSVTGKWSGTNSTVFGVNSAADVNQSGNEHIAYCFHSVAGYSKIGSYNGTSSSGNSVNVGFAPDWVLIKGVTAGSAWILHDNVRSDGTAHLRPNTSGAEDTGANEQINFTSTGFSIRNSGATQINTSGHTYIYAAFKIN